MKKLLLICLLILACEEKYLTLWHEDLDETEVADITAFLQENKYKYKLEKNDSTILVPRETLYEIRMALARNGLPKNHIFIEPPTPSIDKFLQNTEYREAVESEFALVIETLSEVEKAGVSINKDTTALVMVQLHPYKTLDEKQIKGIQHLIASAVDELKTERVSVCVLDDKGIELTENCPEKKAVRSCGSSCGD